LERDKFKKMVDDNRWLKYIPNSLTLCNSLCGFGAILFALNVFRPNFDPPQVLTICAWIILCAMVFDALDGFAARIFNAASMHGMQMDSLADMVTFGVAPAFLSVVMAQCLLQMTLTQTVITLLLAATYLGCAALRLATYNVHAIMEKKSGDKFTGLPSPGGAAAICSMIMFYSINYSDIKNIEWVKYLAMLLPVYAAMLGLLMVSNIPYTHVGKWLQSVRRNRYRLVLLIIMLAVAGVLGIRGIVIIINFYIFSGPVLALLGKLNLLPQKTAPQP
jgi:CDP-diacylglycerol---serine O-phosphatidyltransferase